MKQDERDCVKESVQQCQVSSSGACIFSDYIVPKLFLEALDGFLFTLNTEGIVKFVSDNVENYLKYTPNELLDKNVNSMVHSDDVKYFEDFLSILTSESCKNWLDSDIKSRTQSFNCRLLVKPGKNYAGTNASQPQYNTMLLKVQPQPLSGDNDSRLHGRGHASGESKNFTLACIAEKIMFPAKLPKIPEVHKLITKQNLDGIILETSNKPENCAYGSMRWLEGKRLREYCHTSDQNLIDKHFSEVISRGDNMSGVYRLRIPAGDYLLIQSLSKLVYSDNNRQPECIDSTHQIYRKCTASELDGRAWVHLMTRIFDDSSSLSMSSGLSMSGGDLINQPAFSLSNSEMDPILSAVSCVQSVLNETSNNGFGGTFDPSAMDQMNFNDLSDIMKLLEDQEGSSFTTNGASQSDLNLSLDYLLNCKSADTEISQAASTHYISSPAVTLAVSQQLSTADSNAGNIFCSKAPSPHYSLSVQSQPSADVTNFNLFESDLLSFSQNALLSNQLQDHNTRSLGVLSGSLSQTISSAKSAQGQILRMQLMQSSSTVPCGDASSPRQSQESDLSSLCSNNPFSPDVTNMTENIWKVPQQPDLGKRRRHPSQIGSPAAIQSPLNMPQSPSFSNCVASPASQHVCLKDLLLSADTSPYHCDELSKRQDQDARRVSTDRQSSSTSPYLTAVSSPYFTSVNSPFLSTPSVVLASPPSLSLGTKQSLPQQLESSTWQGRPPLILKSLLADVGTADDSVESDNIDSMISSVNGANQVRANDAFSSNFSPSTSVFSQSSAGSPALISVSYAALFQKSLSSPTLIQQSPKRESPVLPQVAHPPLSTMTVAGLSSLLSSGFVSPANSPVSESPATVISRLMVGATSSSSSSVPVQQQNSASLNMAAKKTTNHLLRQLLEKNSTTTQQQLLPKLIEDQSFVKELSIASSLASVTVAASPSQDGTMGSLSSIMPHTNNSEFLLKLVPSKKPKLNGDCYDDELKARLTELWERAENNDVLPPSSNVLHAGTKRKSHGDVSLHARSFAISNTMGSSSSTDSKHVNGILSQMLLNKHVTTSVSTTPSLSSVATATPQMSMAKNIANLLGRSSSNAPPKSNLVYCSAAQVQKQNELLVSQLKFLSGGTSRTETIPPRCAESTVMVSNSYPVVSQNASSSTRSGDVIRPVVFDDDYVMKFLVPDAPSLASGLSSGSDDAFLQQLEQILSEATESDIDSVLNEGVIAALPASMSTNDTWLNSAATSPLVSIVPTSTAAAEQRAICKIQSQLMRETANIQPVPQQQKLLGLLLSEGNRSSEVESRTAERDPTTVLQHGRPSLSSQSQTNYRLLSQSGVVRRQTSADAVQFPPLSTASSSTNTSENIIAMVQRAAADAAARSGRQASSNANDLMRSRTPVSQQQAVGFSQNPEWINLNDLMNVSFAPNVSLERDPSGFRTTSIHQQSAHQQLSQPIGVNLLSRSSAVRSQGPPVSAIVSSGQSVSASLRVTAAASKLSFSGQLVPSSPLTSPGQMIPGSPVLFTGGMVPGSPRTPAGQSMPSSPLASAGSKVSGSYIAPAGASLRVMMTPTSVNRQPTPSTVVQPVLTAMLGQPVTGGVQLVWNQQANPTFMTGGVIVQGDLLSRLTAVGPTVSNAGESSVCVLGQNNSIAGSAGGSVAVRLISQQPAAVSSLVPTGLVRFVVTEPSRQPVQLVSGQATRPVIVSSILSQQDSRKVQTTAFPPTLVSSASRSDSRSSTNGIQVLQQTSSDNTFYLTQPPSNDSSAVFFEDTEGELPLDVLQSLSELTDEHKIDQTLPTDGQNHEQSLSTIDVNTAADLRIPVIESWLHQPSTQSPVGVLQQYSDQQQTLRVQSPSNSSRLVNSAQLDRNIVLTGQLNNLYQLSSGVRAEVTLQQQQAQLASPLNSSQLNYRIKSDQNVTLSPTKQPTQPIQYRLPAPATSTDDATRRLDMLRYQLLSSSSGRQSSIQVADVRGPASKRSISTSGGNASVGVLPMLRMAGPATARPARLSVGDTPRTSMTTSIAPQSCFTLGQELAARVGLITTDRVPSTIDASWRSSSIVHQQPLASVNQPVTVTSVMASNTSDKVRASQSLLQQLLSD